MRKAVVTIAVIIVASQAAQAQEGAADTLPHKVVPADAPSTDEPAAAPEEEATPVAETEPAPEPAPEPEPTPAPPPPSRPSGSYASTGGDSGSVRRSLDISRSRHEVSAHLGYQAGFGGDFGSPSGLKVSADYAYRFHRLVWFNLQLGNTFGFGGRDGRCANSIDSQCYRGGWDFSAAAGVKLKFETKVPLFIEVPLLVGVEVLYNRNCGDNGASFPVLRPGVRAKYFVTEKIGIGAGVNFAFGPAFHNGGNSVCTSQSYTDFYGAFDFMAGAEFLL